MSDDAMTVDDFNEAIAALKANATKSAAWPQSSGALSWLGWPDVSLSVPVVAYSSRWNVTPPK